MFKQSKVYIIKLSFPAKAFIDSQEFKDMIREAKESHQRVMESKITDRTKL
ncbi:TPA: hypothetical protein O1H43_001187 [Staphylococcus aureus]|nr:hypothetical protein [Staphylococcus aureus]HCY1779643.1 hypothetical protein [Staphylococcus aureus]